MEEEGGRHWRGISLLERCASSHPPVTGHGPRPRLDRIGSSQGWRAHSIPLCSRRGCSVARRLAPRVGRRITTRHAGGTPILAIPSGSACPRSETNQPKKEQKALPPLSPLLFPARVAQGGRGEEKQQRPPRLSNGGLRPPPCNPYASRILRLAGTCKLVPVMESFSRDLLCGIGKGNAPPPEQRPGQLREEMEEVELSLGLSLGGRFGLERKGDKLPRSSSMAAMLTKPVEVPAPPALPRTSSLPVLADASEVGSKQGLDGLGSCREGGGLGVEHAAMLPASGSPSSASSEGNVQRLQDTLMRTSSLPTVIEADGNNEWKKRKEAQSLKRLEVKKKRIERRNSLTKETAGLIPEEMNAHADKIVSSDEAVVMNNENRSSGKHLAKGLPPKYQVTIASQDSSSAVGKKPNSAFKGTTIADEHSLSSSVPSSSEAVSSMTAASPSPLSSAPRTATLGSRGDQSIVGRTAARANSMGDTERRIMQEMPGVFTKDLPNGNRVEGFLYKYRKGEDVRIICICHGSFLTPSEFVEHAGAGKVDNPLRHIVVSPTPNL